LGHTCVCLVHNGIIENYKSLRAELVACGRRFASETDTEVVAQLLDRELDGGADPKAALIATLGRLEGAFALAAIIEGEPGLVLGARRGAPLVAAVGDGASFLTSWRLPAKPDR
jgi:glucosamine--fructose-6-phosphate aminotransferase (isomerizing)